MFEVVAVFWDRYRKLCLTTLTIDSWAVLDRDDVASRAATNFGNSRTRARGTRRRSIQMGWARSRSSQIGGGRCKRIACFIIADCMLALQYQPHHDTAVITSLSRLR